MDHLHELACQAKEAAGKLAAVRHGRQEPGRWRPSPWPWRPDQGEILEANDRDMAQAEQSGMSSGHAGPAAPDAGAHRRHGQGRPGGHGPAGPHRRGAWTPWCRPNGLNIRKVRVPLGVVGIIYEARPNVTVDAAVLCLKSGNAAFLRGGKEAFGTNLVLAGIMRDALAQAGLDSHCVHLPGRTPPDATADAMMRLQGYIDVLIPRGGAGLIRRVLENATVPVIETGTGNCHLYVDKSADLDMAVEILFNGKCLPSLGVQRRWRRCWSTEAVARAVFARRLMRRLEACHVELAGL